MFHDAAPPPPPPPLSSAWATPARLVRVLQRAAAWEVRDTVTMPRFKAKQLGNGKATKAKTNGTAGKAKRTSAEVNGKGRTDPKRTTEKRASKASANGTTVVGKKRKRRAHDDDDDDAEEEAMKVVEESGESSSDDGSGSAESDSGSDESDSEESGSSSSEEEEEEEEKPRKKRKTKEAEPDDDTPFVVGAVPVKDCDFLAPHLKELLPGIGYKTLFPVQVSCYSHVVNGTNVLVKARTGTGKTLGFSLPIAGKLCATEAYVGNPSVRAGGAKLVLGVCRPQKRGRAPKVLVMCPTRELAIQVAKVFLQVAPSLKHLCIYGGSAYGPQEAALSRGVDIVVGTPGRIIDHMNRELLRFEDLEFVVLDEADKMLSIGFLSDMETVLGKVPKACQVCLFSATVPKQIRQVAAKFLKKYELIDLVGDQDAQTARRVNHYALRCDSRARPGMLGDLIHLYAGKKGRCIVFAETKAECNRLVVNSTLPSDFQPLHGDISQAQREVTMEGFRQGKFRCLVATDVAARGIDVSGIDLVIMCEPPHDTDTYVHRSGRTGRAGCSGNAITLFTRREENEIWRLQRDIGIEFTQLSVPTPEQMIAASAKEVVSDVEAVDKAVAAVFKETAAQLIDDLGAEKALCRALALAAGHSKEPLPRSLLTGREGYATLLIHSKYQIRSKRYLMTTLESLLEEGSSTEDRFGEIRLSKDGYSGVIDLNSALMEHVLKVAPIECRTATIERCTELPDDIEGPGSSTDRGNNGGRWGRGGGGRGGRDNGRGYNNRRGSFGGGRGGGGRGGGRYGGGGGGGRGGGRYGGGGGRGGGGGGGGRGGRGRRW